METFSLHDPHRFRADFPVSPGTNGRPAAIVLKMGITGMATARALADGGVDVHVAAFNRKDPGLRSSRFTVADVVATGGDPERVRDWLLDYAAQLGNRPVVIPTSDTLALMLAQYRDRLSDVCRVWNTSYNELSRIVSKERLYRAAEENGVPVVPMIITPEPAQLAEWCERHPAPYFVKPYYEAAPGCALGAKNRIFDDAAELLGYVRRNGAAKLIVQRLIEGGDEHIFDCYGMCGADGCPLVLASHSRLRQYPPDRGTTTFGEIPASPDDVDEQALFALTRKLLEAVRYHGIFGIEWLQERDTGNLYLIDFNARPFLSVGHLRDCGLNLPFLAYQELVGEPLGSLSLTPRLRHLFWLDLWRDFGAFRATRARRSLSWWGWLNSLPGCRSFAYWDAGDPGPAWSRTRERLGAVGRKLLHHTAT